MGAPKHVIVGTAGHIDHGKTALVEALTGVNADRWEEERRRGITIDLGFADLDLDEGLRAGFIDVPGHERFVRNMLAGASGIDVVLFVIAADESIMPQTREHFDICRLLGVQRGVIALTKADLVEPDLVELVRLEAQEFVEGSFLDGAPVVAVSAKTGAGLDELRAALAEAAREVTAKSARSRFRLPVDRSFVIKGFGSVVTGTLVAGAVSLEDEVEVHPLGRRVRVRGLQRHGEKVSRADAGSRTAVNLAGIDASELARGMTLSEPGVFEPSTDLDCELDLLASAPALKHGSPVHFHIGAAELEGKVLLLERSEETGQRVRSLAPGGRAFARVRLKEPALAVSGDRFVIRRFSPVTTIGGGRVLDPQPPRREAYAVRVARLRAFASGDLAMILDNLALTARDRLEAADVVRRTGALEADIRAAAGALLVVREAPLALVHSERLAAAQKKLLDDLAAFHKANPLLAGKPRGAVHSGPFATAPEAFVEYVIASLVKAKKIAEDGELLRLATHSIQMDAEEEKARDAMVNAFVEAGLEVPTLKAFLPTLPVDAKRAQRLLGALLREGLLVRISVDLVFHRDALQGLLAKLAERKALDPRLTVPEFKDLSGVSRKYAIPLLEYLDRARITRRDGDARVIN
ncbi:MAG: selenocysteine-specific translation elongation factor [Acidobacteria bacterium]|nr:selenocysteine-specific translation elongation factor [Acidobacteriota bacterium]